MVKLSLSIKKKTPPFTGNDPVNGEFPQDAFLALSLSTETGNSPFEYKTMKGKG